MSEHIQMQDEELWTNTLNGLRNRIGDIANKRTNVAYPCAYLLYLQSYFDPNAPPDVVIAVEEDPVCHGLASRLLDVAGRSKDPAAVRVHLASSIESYFDSWQKVQQQAHKQAQESSSRQARQQVHNGTVSRKSRAYHGRIDRSSRVHKRSGKEGNPHVRQRKPIEGYAKPLENRSSSSPSIGMSSSGSGMSPNGSGPRPCYHDASTMAPAIDPTMPPRAPNASNAPTVTSEAVWSLFPVTPLHDANSTGGASTATSEKETSSSNSRKTNKDLSARFSLLHLSKETAPPSTVGRRSSVNEGGK